MTLRRVLAALAGCVLVMSGLVAPSGAAAAPSVPDPLVAVEPLAGEVAASSSDELAVSEDEADEPKSSDDEAKKPAPKAAADDGKKPVAAPKATDDEKSDEATSGGSSGSAADKGKTSTDDETKPSTGEDEPSDEPKASDSDDEATSGGVKHSGGGKATLPTDDDEDAPSDDTDGEGVSSSDLDEIESAADPKPSAGTADESGASRGGEPAPIKPLASGQIADIIPTVLADGTTALNGAVEVAGVVLDDDDSNGVVATYDIVTYQIEVVYGAVAQGDTLSLVGELPEGVTWQTGSYSLAACDLPSSTGYNNTRKFTCDWTSNGETKKIFTWFARPVSPPLAGSTLANPVSFAPTFSDGVQTVDGPSVRVVAAPAVDATVQACVATGNIDGTDVGYAGRGYRINCYVTVGSWRSDVRGLEVLAGPFYPVEVKVPQGALLRHVSSYVNAAGVSASQSGGAGGLVTVMMPASLPLFTGAGMSMSNSNTSSATLSLFVPDSSFPVDVPKYLATQVVGFDPVGLSGESNYGSGLAPGQQPLAECVTTFSLGGNCGLVTVTHRSGPQLGQRWAFVHRPGSAESIFGAANTSNAVGSWGPRVVPGESFVSLLMVQNTGSAGGDMTNASSCVTWDSDLAALQGPARLVGLQQLGGIGNWYPSLVTGTQLPTSQYLVEYASVSGLTPGSFVCGQAGGGDDTATWRSDPSHVPGGAPAVNAIRLTLGQDTPLEPTDTFGLALPVARTTTPASLELQPGAQIAFWNTQSADESFATGSSAATVSGSVGADRALVRASTQALAGSSWVSSATAAAGDQAMFRFTPTVIGPAADVNTVATNTNVRLSFDSACVDPSMAMDALAAYSAQLIDSGQGPAGCAADSKNGPVIMLTLGDTDGNVTAPGSSTPAWITQASVGGHETVIGAPIEVPAVLSTLTPTGLVIHMTTLISSDSDTTAVVSDPGSRTNDRLSWAAVSVNTPQTFTARKAAVTAQTGLVDPGETFTYTHLLSNTQSSDYGVASFVDVVPFEGDPRLGSRPDGLAGGGRLTVLGASASMVDGAGVSQPVAVYCSTANPAAIYASLAVDKSGGAIPGTFGWSNCSGGVPPGTTAVRFVTGVPLESMAMVTGSITVKAPGLAVGGYLVNDMAYEAPAAPGSGLADQRGFIGVPVELLASSAVLSGTVARDLNFNGTADPVGGTGDGWWPVGAVVRLLTPGGDPVVDLVTGDPYTAVVGADGAFVFPLIPAGEFRVALTTADAPVSTWRLLGNAPVTVPVSSTTTTTLLYQEIVPDPVLVDDAAKTGVGGTVTIDVTANDTLSTPTVSTVTPAQLVLKGSGTTANGGTYVVSSSPGGVYAGQPQVTFTASATWPAGESGLSYTESFEYSWTNAVGVEVTATVTVTVQKGPSASGGTARIPVDGSHTFDADPQTYGTIETASVKDGPSQGTVTVDTTGNVTFDGTGADPGVYSFTVEWTDDLGQKCVSEYTVTVQAPPTASGGTAKIPVGGSHTFDADPQPKATIVSASVKGEGPSQGTASVDHTTGMVTFDGTGAEPGTYSFDVEWEDDLGQTCTSTYTVTVQAPPTASGGTAKIRVDGSHTFDADPQPRETIVSASVTTGPSQGSVSVDHTTGEVTFDGTGVEPGEYTFEVTWVDDLDQTCVSEYTVVVQAAPTATGGTVTIPENGSHTFDADLTGSIVSASVTKAPSHGTVIVDHATGEVSFDGAGVPDGTYTFEVTWIDDVGQYCTSTYTVTVRSLKVTGDPETRLGTGETKSHRPVVNHPDHVVSVTFLSLPAQGTVTYDPATGEVRYVAGARVGTFTYELEWTDDLGQTARLFHTVIVGKDNPDPPPPTPTPIPTTPTPTPPTPEPTTPRPSPTKTTDPPVVGTGGTVSGGGLAGPALLGIAILFAVALMVGRRRGNAGR